MCCLSLTNSIDKHGKPPERSDGDCEVLLGIVQLLDVAADLLNHDLALLGLAPDFIDLPKQLPDSFLCIAQILPVDLNQACLAVLRGAQGCPKTGTGEHSSEFSSKPSSRRGKLRDRNHSQ